MAGPPIHKSPGCFFLARLDRLRPNLPPSDHFHYLSFVKLNAIRIVTRHPIGARLRQLWRRRQAKHEMIALRDRLRSPLS